MSYQLIYSGKCVPTGDSANGHTVAASSSTPRALKQELLSISRYRTPDANSCLHGDRHSYRMLICADTTFHVLSCMRTDTTGGYCVHHLALTQDEVQSLRRNASRPTPAGVTMALSKIGFWHSPNTETENEPRLTAAALPEAAAQPSWLRLTGHKNNARALLSNRCERECILSMPKEATTEDVLHLLHESDWLASHRGWGKTFTTHGSTRDSTTEFARIATISGSSVAEQARAGGIAVLEINHELNIYEESDSPRAEERENEQTPNIGLHYKYDETPDEAVFNLPPKPGKWLRWVCILGGVWVLWSSVSLVSGLWIEDAGELTGNIITRINTEEDLQLLSELAAAPYTAETTARKLDRIEAHLNSHPPTAEDNNKHRLLRECVKLLRCAATDALGHGGNMSRLAESAPSLRINAASLCALYMNELIHDRQAEEWHSSLTPDEIQDWQNLLEAHPNIRAKLSEQPFADYLPRPSPTPAVPEAPEPVPAPENPEPEETPAAPEPDIAPTEQPTETPAVEPPPTETPTAPAAAAESMIPTIVNVGSELPQELQSLLGNTSVELSGVEYEVVPIGTNTVGVASDSLPPEDSDAKLCIAPMGTPGEWKLFPKLAEQNTQADTEVRLSTKDGKLQNIVYKRLPAAIRLKIKNSSNILCTYILIPECKSHLHGSIAKIEKEAPEKFRITPESLTLARNGQHAQLYKLDFRPNKGFTELNKTRPLSFDSELQLQLPGFARNHCIVEPAEGYKCKDTALSSPGSSADMRKLSISKTFNFETPMLKAFLQAGNVSCCGEKPDGAEHLTLASLYSIAAEKTSTLGAAGLNAQVDRYFRLFHNDYFAEQLRRIFNAESYLWLTAEEAKGGKGGHQARRRITKLLKDKETLRLIRTRICDVLSNVSVQSYNRQYERVAQSRAVSLLLRLRNVELTPSGELTWYFVLEPLTE